MRGDRGMARVLHVLLLAIAALVPLHSQGQAQAEEWRFSVPPYLSPARMDEIYAPIAAHLGQSLGRSVVFRTSSNFDRYYEQVVAGGMDITFTHAFFYVVAVDQHGYVPLVRMIEPFKGLLVVLDQSPAKSLADLRGKTIATPPENLPTVHLIRQIMREQNFDPNKDFSMRGFRSVESCLQQLIIGEAAACIAPPFALPGAEAQFKVRFRTIVESPGIPSLTFLAHPRLSTQERARLRSVLLAMNDSEAGKALLRNIGSRGLVDARNTEYDPVRRLMKNMDAPWLSSPR